MDRGRVPDHDRPGLRVADLRDHAGLGRGGVRERDPELREGDGMVWHAPHSGAVVRPEPIWTSSVFYGRVA